MPLFRTQSAAVLTSHAPHGSRARLRTSQGFMAKPCTPHPHCAARAALRATNLPMCGVEGQGPSSLLLVGCKGGCSLPRKRTSPLVASPHGVGQSQLSNMYPRRFQHQLFGANGIKRHLKQRIAAHRGDGDDQSVTERLVVDLVAGGKLKQRRGGGGLLRREFLRRLRFWSALHDAVVARRALTVATVAARRIRASLVKARVAKAGRALRLTADPVGILRRDRPPKNARVH